MIKLKLQRAGVLWTPLVSNVIKFVWYFQGFKVKTEKLHVNYLPPSICGSGSIFFGFYVQVASMYERKNVCEFNENFLQCAHTDINYTNKGCMTCGEKQEIQYHRYLTSIH